VLENGEEGIVLEGVPVPTFQVMSMQLGIGDLVQADWGFSRLNKLASSKDLKKQGIVVPEEPIDWEQVIGVLY
jgi:hypothetical protein